MLRAREAALKAKVAPAIRKAMREARAPHGPLPAHQIAYQKANFHYKQDLEAVQRLVAAGAPRRGMTDPELVAVRSYSSNGYKPLNSALWSGDPNRVASIAAFRDTLNDALSKLPDHPATTRRGVDLTDAQRARYKVGEIVTEPAFTSSGKEFHRNTLFAISGRHGKLIQPYSAVPDEHEVLYPAPTRFRVLKRETVGGVVVITLKEVD